MGTRSLTHVKDHQGKTLVTMYRHFDGYPTGHGKELADFLKDYEVSRTGLGISKKFDKVANGMGCLAALIIAYFKEEPGGIYIYPPNTKDVWEEYVYEVSRVSTEQFDRPYLKVYDVPKKRKRLLWKGFPEDFDGQKLEDKLNEQWA